LANPEHLAILKRGVEVWNQWRNRALDERVHIADLRKADLSGMDLRRISLVNAHLHGVNLVDADLRFADLRNVILSNANLRGAKLSGAIMTHAGLDNADLSGAELFLTNLSGADLSGTRLMNAGFVRTNLDQVNLKGADLTDARLNGAILTRADLSGATGLENCLHLGPVAIDFHTCALSRILPLRFLRGCGLPEAVIVYLPSLLGRVIQFYSCFISYSSKDQDFADRLYADLQNNGVRCWFAPEDLKIGDPFRQRIDESIQFHDKLLLILSERSVRSRWVQDEVEAALEREHQDNRLVLFPIRIDDAVMETNEAWAASIRRTRHIGDFRTWKNHDSYQEALRRLLRDLKSGGEEKR
jgi:hypothetical protein